jgi:hypothetical protein
MERKSLIYCCQKKSEMTWRFICSLFLFQDSSRGSYEGDRPPSDESPPPDTSEQNGHISSSQTAITRSISATAACIAAIKRRSGAFDTPEERERRRRSNLSSSSTSGKKNSQEFDQVPNSPKGVIDVCSSSTIFMFFSGGIQERRSSSRVDSGSVDMETPLSPRSPLDNLEASDGSLPPVSSNGTTSSSMPNGRVGSVAGTSVGSSYASTSSSRPTNSSHPPLVNGHGIHYSQSSSSSSNNTCIPSHSGHNNNNNNNHVIISSPPVPQPVPQPVPVLHPQPITISHSPSPATPSDTIMTESTNSLISDRRVPIVPPRRCRTRSPTPNTSHGKISYSYTTLHH